MSRYSIIACAVVAGLIATAAAAEAAPPITVVEARVPYGDLDLASPDGARTILARIRQTSERLCAQPISPLLPRAAAEAYRCRTSLMANAVARLDAPAVTQAYANLSTPAVVAAGQVVH